MPEIFVPITLFLVIGAVVIIHRVMTSHERQKLADVIRVAYEHNQNPAPELINALNRPYPRAGREGRDFRVALVTIAIALALLVRAGLGIAMGRPWDVHLVGIALLPGFIGLAFLFLALRQRRNG